MSFQPSLEASECGGVHLLHDPAARAAGVLVAFSDRRGGASAPPYDSLNLSAKTGDDPARVEENRRRVAAAAGFEASTAVYARQVHGADVVEARPGDSGTIGRCDGFVARGPGVTLTIMTADCTPVLVWGDDGVVALHSGWRGLVAGVLERGLEILGTPRAAWIGPAIRACCYEVGPEVLDAFRARDLPVADERHVDPSRGAEAVLRRAGVERIARAEGCTSCSPHLFSYRRDGVTGRQGAFAALL
ncbi:MAG TPA: polyphenol oxidase family protein [Actinomycetota bacterium]|nr:polyphenol oxidase family protein [Actinomycetota bacterium]